MFRVGLGIDSHRLTVKSTGRYLKLGGVSIGRVKVDARSDGDVILHALCNSLSQALGGSSFSKIADALWCRGISDSQSYVKVFCGQMEAAGYKLSNIGVVLEAGKPKLEMFNYAIRKQLAGLLNVKDNQVGLTITSGEKLTPFGQGKGIQATVIVLMEKNETQCSCQN